MNPVVLFGAGDYGKSAAGMYLNQGREISYFIDNDPHKQGGDVAGIPVISLEDYLRFPEKYDLVVTVDFRFRDEVIDQLHSSGIEEFTLFYESDILCRERLISYSQPDMNEDVILYHVLKEEKEIFWVDIGCNDPDIASVTRLFYDRGHHGVNVDLNEKMIGLYHTSRPRDISIRAGVGAENCLRSYVEQGPYGTHTTMIDTNIRAHHLNKKTVEITTLAEICRKYVGNRQISFLKIDVEGMEKDVLMGADFDAYRPMILVIESVVPLTEISSYPEWENIVLNHGYHFVYARGVNRYYVADEHSRLDQKFVPWVQLIANYCVLYADLLFTW